MTVRSWDRTAILGPNTAPMPAPYRRQVYAQNGTNTPRALRDQGIYRDNAYSLTITEAVYPPIVLGLFGNTYNTGGNALSAGVAYDTVVPVPYSDVLPKLLGKWRNSEFQAGVTIGEGRESAVMMYERLRSIAQAAQHAKNRNLGGALRSLSGVSKDARRSAERRMRSGDVSGGFLEIMMGWAPLVEDVYALADYIRLDPKVGRIRAGARNSVLSGQLSSTQYLKPSDLFILQNERRLHLVVEVSQAPSEIERLGLTDPASILWQLKSLSFLADWFLPIGSTLQSLHAAQAMPVTKCIETRVQKARARIFIKAGQKYGSYTALSSATVKHDYVTMTRTISSSLPSAWNIVAQVPLAVVSDISNWDVDLYKLSVGAALAHQRVLSLLR